MKEIKVEIPHNAEPPKGYSLASHWGAGEFTPGFYFIRDCDGAEVRVILREDWAVDNEGQLPGRLLASEVEHIIAGAFNQLDEMTRATEAFNQLDEMIRARVNLNRFPA